MFLHFLVSSWLGRVPRPVALSHGPFQQAQILGGAPLVLRSRFLEHLSLSCGISILLSVCCLIQSLLLASVHVVSNISLIIFFSGRSPFSSSFKVSWTFFFGREYWPVEHLLFYASFWGIFFSWCLQFVFCQYTNYYEKTSHSVIEWLFKFLLKILFFFNIVE